jgi:predicted metallopeptidase
MFEDAPDIVEIAKRLVAEVDDVAHIDLGDVLFFRELETSPPALAACFNLQTHPIGFFTAAKYAIVLYWMRCDYMTFNQLVLLIYHEMLHIPTLGKKLVDHDVQDFRKVLGIDLDWAQPGQEVPLLLVA